METVENMQEYVVRKLQDECFNLYQIGIATDIGVMSIYNIRDGKSSSYSNIQTLHDFFRKMAD